MFVSKRKYNSIVDWAKYLSDRNYLLELEIEKLKKPIKKTVAKKATVKKVDK